MRITDEEYDNPWKMGGIRFSLDDELLNDYVGFVYVIECTHPDELGRKYVGQKLLWGKKYSQKTNKKTKVVKKTKIRIPSDWKKYYGSSAELGEAVEKYGVSHFKRSIIHLCRSKGAMNYLEMAEQVTRKVLLRDDYYNSFIGGKIHRRHIAKYLDDIRREEIGSED